VTNSGDGTSIIGDVGVSPGTSVTGMPAGQPVGATYLGGDAVVVQAQADLTKLYDDLGTRACPASNLLSGQDLAGKTLLPGVYCFASSATLGADCARSGAARNAERISGTKVRRRIVPQIYQWYDLLLSTPSDVVWRVGVSAGPGRDLPLRRGRDPPEDVEHRRSATEDQDQLPGWGIIHPIHRQEEWEGRLDRDRHEILTTMPTE
jgi:hypothetical protein